MGYGILSRGTQTRQQAMGLMRDNAREETQRNMQNAQLERAEKTEKVSGTTTGAMAGAYLGAQAGSIGGPAGAAIGAVAGYALTELF
ncbi:YMGG-like glycine zipper-containing protein [Catenovulum sediminis]|uniref:YMGG-like glycine zipper-containing protein n=1 Tax=Catenovulum sediminis TaxID=1740262 RepID=A0ABV1RH99_9ALTE